MNIKEIAESITEDPNVILEADPTRRDFLKRSAGTAAAAAKGDLLGAVTSAAGVQKPNIQSLIQGYNPSEDPFAHISDEELTETPESEWVFAVPYSRLLRIMKNSGDESAENFPGGYANLEISYKTYTLTCYLATGASPPQWYAETVKVIKRMKEAAQEAGVLDVPTMMDSITKYFGDYQSDELSQYTKWFPSLELFGDSDDKSMALKVIHAIDKISKESGLPISKKTIIHTIDDIRSKCVADVQQYRQSAREFKKQRIEQHKKQLKGKAKTPKSGVEKERTLSKSGETGGLPPLQPRSITRRQRDFPYKDASLTSKAESPYPTFESKLDRELNTINELFFRPSYKYKVTIEYKNHESPGKPIIITRLVEADSANEAFAYVHTSYCEYNKLYPDNLDMIYDFLVVREDGKEFTPRSKGFDYSSGWAGEWHETSAVDPLKHISDEELIDTPERQWITKIPYSRLLNIIKSAKPSSANWNSQYNIGYAKGELIVKTSMIATYICQGLQPSPGGYNDHLARKVHEAISNTELLAYLLSAMKDAGINFSKRDEELLKESMIDSIRTNDSCNWSEEVADALSRVCNKIGLNISAGDISRKYEEISNLNNNDDFEDENDYTLE